tara:strand:- start:367 stop:1113 length:747 start_codon:yes stop_codon:yes gene_type:complete
MAKKSGLGQEFYIHGYDLSGDVGSLDGVGAPRGLLDITAINKSAVERLNGRSDATLSFNTWFNDATEQEHAALSGLVTTDRIVLWAMGGSTGDAACAFPAKQLDYDGSRGADGSLAFSVSCVADGVAADWCALLTDGQVTHASAGSNTSRDDGAATSAGMVAYLEIVDCDSGTPTVQIQESSDNGSSDAWTNVVTFSSVGYASTPTAERLTMSGTVKRYLRVTTTGTFSNADFIVATRRGTDQDDVSL